VNKERKDFENSTQWFGYLASGKTFGDRNYYKVGTKLCEDYQKGWDIGKVELNQNI